MMTELKDLLPHVTATLNALSLILILIGFTLVKAGRSDLHRPVMLSAVVVSALFLVSYLLHHLLAPIFQFGGQGLVRKIYYPLLISHVILAIAVVPFILITLRRALAGRRDDHRRIARWTWPIWVYVCVTGLVVYVMLYHVYPPAAAAVAAS